jgi:hypothetical protein
MSWRGVDFAGTAEWDQILQSLNCEHPCRLAHVFPIFSRDRGTSIVRRPACSPEESVECLVANP